MKYRLQSINVSAGRLGCISNMERFPNLVIETPTIMLYTKGGSIPHITYDVLQYIIGQEKLIMQFPMFNFFHSCDSIVKSNCGLSHYVGMPEYPSLCVIRDCATKVLNKFNKVDAMAIWTRNGKHFVGSERFMDYMESFQPDMYVALSDGISDINSSSKRIAKAVDKTSVFFDYCVTRHRSSDVLRNRAIIGAVQGGYNIEARERSAKHLSALADGFLIDGLYTDGSQVENMKFEPAAVIIKETLKYLPEDRVKFIYGAWNPETILKMVKLGIDVFDTSLPYLVAERGAAFNFPYDLSILQNYEPPDDLSDLLNVVHISGTVNDNVDSGFSSSSCSSSCTSLSSSPSLSSPTSYEISLHDKRYLEDFRPLVEGCGCLACTKYSRSYIHHLLVTRELLAPVLLTIHNIHYYMEFFAAIRTFLKESYASPAEAERKAE